MGHFCNLLGRVFFRVRPYRVYLSFRKARWPLSPELESLCASAATAFADRLRLEFCTAHGLAGCAFVRKMRKRTSAFGCHIEALSWFVVPCEVGGRGGGGG